MTITKEKYNKLPEKYKQYFKRVVSGGVVLDPFCGSGTTLMACKKTNRDFIGIDQDPNYCEISRKRIDATPKPLKI